jgi:hypothetical protein
VFILTLFGIFFELLQGKEKELMTDNIPTLFANDYK